MAPPTVPPQLPQRLSQPSALCAVEKIAADGVNPSPGSATRPDPVEAHQSLTRHITVPPPQSATGVLFSPRETGLTSQTLLPEVVSSADLSSGAQLCTRIAVRGASMDESTHCSHPTVSGEVAGPSAGPIPSHPGSPRVAAASKVVGKGANVAIEADSDGPLCPASARVSAATGLSDLPNEVLIQILRYLDVCDLLCTSRVSPDLLLPRLSCRIVHSVNSLPLPCCFHGR